MSRSTPAPFSFLPEALYGLVGSPVAHSLSPLLHNTGFQTLGIPATYLRWNITPQALARFVDAMRVLGLAGASVTIPHKSAIMPLLDAISDTAQAVGAVNTLYLRNSSLCGENTDVTGFLSPIAGLGLLPASDIVLLGSGGAALAAAAGLTQHGFTHVHIATMSDTSHLPVAERFGLIPLRWNERMDVPARLVINATPLGMQGQYEDKSPYDFACATALADTSAGIAYDMVYTPLQTRFLREAAATGRHCVSGLAMFFGQADAQFRLWTGRGLPAEAFQATEAALFGRTLQ